MSGGWLQVAQEALKIPGLLVEVYGDLARPGVKQVGKALETILGLGNTVLWPIALANERSRISLERNLERYRKEMENIPEDKVVAAAPEIGVPVAEKLAYVGDDNLADLYVKLLATASNADTLGNAHPSFVNVINNLSPDEARLLRHFVNRTTLPFVMVRAQAVSGGYSPVAGPFVADEVLEGLSFSHNLDAYFSNLAGLGMLSYRQDEWLANESVYEPLESKNKSAYEKLFEVSPQLSGKKMKFARGVIRITSFGSKFISACHGP